MTPRAASLGLLSLSLASPLPIQTHSLSSLWLVHSCPEAFCTPCLTVGMQLLPTPLLPALFIPASAPTPPSGGQLGHPVLNLGPHLPVPCLPRVGWFSSLNCLACFCVRAYASSLPCPQGPAGPDTRRLWAPIIMCKPSLPGAATGLPAVLAIVVFSLSYADLESVSCHSGHCPPGPLPGVL